MPDNRAFDMPYHFSPWEEVTDLTSADLSGEERTPMPDRSTNENLQSIADTLRENSDKVVASEDGHIAYRPEGFSERDREMEDISRTLRREQQADPLPGVSDDEVLRRLGRRG